MAMTDSWYYAFLEKRSPGRWKPPASVLSPRPGVVERLRSMIDDYGVGYHEYTAPAPLYHEMILRALFFTYTILSVRVSTDSTILHILALHNLLASSVLRYRMVHGIKYTWCSRYRQKARIVDV